jgi:hypothetical protein
LGNKGFTQKRIEIADMDAGIQIVERLYMDSTVTGCRNLILLCVCKYYEKCHRKVVADGKRNEIRYYDFQIQLTRNRGAIPETKNQQQALKAEAQIRTAVFDGKYGKPSGEASFMEYTENVFLPWSKDNKLSYQNDFYKITY